MAISVDRVYQKVLALANKEQRGYITPQEFNLFADQAQMEIFEQYFYDLEQRQRGTGNELDYADIITNIEEKISIFEIANQGVSSSSEGDVDISSSIGNFYRLGSVQVTYYDNGYACEAEPIKLNELNKYKKSPLAVWTKTRPVYSRHSNSLGESKIKIYPPPQTSVLNSDTVSINYTRRPIPPNWTYLLGGSKNALYNPSATDHQDFQLHSSEENNLVVKILQLAGIAIKDFQLTGVAAQEEMKGLQQKNR